MPQSSEISAKRKPKTPDKPYADFPLFAHQTGRWAKKVRGKMHFYGRWGKTVDGKIVPSEDVNATAAIALAEFNRCWPHHSQGREAPSVDAGDYLTMIELANSYLEHKENRIGTRELSAQSFDDYYRICATLIEQFGKTRRVDTLKPEDFDSLRAAMADGCNLVTLKNKVNRARMVFKHAFDSKLIDKPVNFGKSFDRPSTMRLRVIKNASGPNLFHRDDLLLILQALEGKAGGKNVRRASPEMLAMVLLGVNAGFGNTDCANLPQAAVNLKTGWIEFPRPKTAVARRVKLWPETVEALRKAIAVRPSPIDPADSDLCFLTERGTRFVRVQPSKTSEKRIVVINALSRRFEQILTAMEIGHRKGIGFYTLRHVFETIGGGSKDQVAVDSIMGHVDPSMASNYRESIDDDRLIAVANHVREWLWPKPANKIKTAKTSKSVKIDN